MILYKARFDIRHELHVSIDTMRHVVRGCTNYTLFPYESAFGCGKEVSHRA
jgi:hypothetical protein